MFSFPHHLRLASGIAAISLLAVASSSRSDSVVTDPVGFTTTSCLTNSDTLVAMPFTRPQIFVGSVASVAGSTLTVSGSPGWTTDQFVYVAGTQPNHHYALIGPAGTTNPKEGHLYTITSNSSSSLTLDTASDSVTGVPAGAQVVIIPYWTPATLFPATDSGVSFTPTTSPPFYKTLLRVPNYAAAGINLPYAAEYYFSGSSWQRISPAGIGDDDPLIPDGHLVVRTSNGAPTLPLTNIGAVLSKKVSTPLATAASPGQDNPSGLIRPLNVPLNATGLSSVFGASDQLLVFNNAQGAFDKAPSAIYTFDTRWRRSGDTTMSDYGGNIIPQGAGFVVRRSGGAPLFWTNSFPVVASSAVSRITHGGVATPFDVNLPLGTTPGIECRSGGAGSNYQIVFTFLVPVTFASAVLTSGIGNVGSVTSSKPSTGPAAGGTIVTANLAGVTNMQYVTLTLAGVNDGANTNDVAVRMGVLIGDTTGDGTVNSADIGQTKSKSGQSVNASNFRNDVNADANLNSADIGQVKSKSGTALPAP